MASTLVGSKHIMADKRWLISFMRLFEGYKDSGIEGGDGKTLTAPPDLVGAFAAWICGFFFFFSDERASERRRTWFYCAALLSFPSFFSPAATF